jgi:hypothetical protein
MIFDENLAVADRGGTHSGGVYEASRREDRSRTLDR